MSADTDHRAAVSSGTTALVFAAIFAAIIAWDLVQTSAPAVAETSAGEAQTAAVHHPPAMDGPPSEATGQDLYRRGFYKEAIENWQEAAENGDAGAAYRVGAVYLDGTAVDRDVKEALVWLIKGADMGDARAQGELGTLYDWGTGVEADPVKAAKWYELAAEGGHASSMYNVGVMYELGQGVAADPVKAYMYYYLANDFGFPKYPAEALEKLEPKLSNQQIKEATDRAREFKARK